MKKNFTKIGILLSLGLLFLSGTYTSVHAQTSAAATTPDPTAQAKADQASYQTYVNKVAADQKQLSADSGNASATALDNAQLQLDQDEVTYYGEINADNEESGGFYTNDQKAKIAELAAKTNQDKGALDQLIATSAQSTVQQKQAAAQDASVQAAAASTNSGQAAAAATNADNECDLFNIVPCVQSGVAAVAIIFASFAGFILGLIGSVFNWMVVVTIFQFGQYFGNSQGLLIAWGILRDVGNIVLVGAFIFMAILLILDLQGIDARKAIPRLVIVALLLNFSLFGAEAVVDVANVVSAALYNQAGAAQVTCATSNGPGSPQTCATSVGISSLIISATGIGNIFSSNNLSNEIKAVQQNFITGIIAYIGIAIFMFITAFVLLAASIMLIIRAVVLMFVLVLAPLGFVALVIPPLKKQGDQWVHTLISQAFYAPVLLLLILVSLKIMSALKTAFSAGAQTSMLQALLAPSLGGGSIFIFFALVTGFMIASIITSKSMGAIGADFAIKTARQGITRTAQAPLRLGAIGAQVAYRHTGGKFFDGAGKTYASTMGKLRDQKGVVGFGAKIFDNALGNSIEGGISAARDAKLPGTKNYTEKKKLDKERAEHTSHAAEIATLRQEFKDGLKASGNASLTAAQRQAGLDKVERSLQKMPQGDVEEMLSTLKIADQETVGKIMSSDKLDKVLDSKNVSAAIKEKMVDARFKAFEDAVNTYNADPTGVGPTGVSNFDAAKSQARRLSNKDMKILGTHKTEFFDTAVSSISDPSRPGGTGESIWTNDQLNDMSKNEVYTTRQRGMANATKVPEQLKAAVAAGNRISIQNLAKNIGSEIGDMPPNVLTNPDVIDNLSTTHLANIMSKNNLRDQAAKDAIMNRIKRNPGSSQYTAVKNYMKGPQQGWWGQTPWP